METPIYDFLKQYSESGTVRFHMPGHKGRCPHPALSAISAYDLTEIEGADSLFEADGIIEQAERNASALFHTQETMFLTGGSTLGIQTMLSSVLHPGDAVIAARNAHRAFINTCALLDLSVCWVLPNSRDAFGVSGAISPESLEAAFAQCPDAKAVYVTSPDYMGWMSDIEALSAVCRRHGVPLLVDNAHGAHLAFGTKNRHPIALGASMCCDSAHKTLPVFTGGAYVHTAPGFFVTKQEMRKNASLFGSTSPSYLIMMSLDLCNDYLERYANADFAALEKKVRSVRDACAEASFLPQEGICDDTKITLDASHVGMSGGELADHFRSHGIECEYAGERHVVFMVSPQNPDSDFECFLSAVRAVQKRFVHTAETVCFALPAAVMAPRTAMFSKKECVPIEAAVGRIAAETRISCPPGVPVIVAGEKIDDTTQKILKNSGVSSINVVK